jgi:hypothetical protein
VLVTCPKQYAESGIWEIESWRVREVEELTAICIFMFREWRISLLMEISVMNSIAA